MYATESLKIAEKIGDIREIGGIYDTHALICCDLKQYDMALFYAEKAIENLRKTDNYLYLIEYLETKIRVQWNLGKFGDAVLTCSEALEIARQFTTAADIERLTATMHRFITEKCLIKIFREGRAISVFENYVLLPGSIKLKNHLICVEIHSDRYAGIGIEKGCFAVVEESYAKNGDLVAIRKSNSDESFLGFIDFQLNIDSNRFLLRLPGGFSDLRISRREFDILGRVVGYCEEPKAGEIELKVKPLKIKNSI